MVQQRNVDVRVERFGYAKPFRIAGHVFTESSVVVVEVSTASTPAAAKAAAYSI